MDEPKHVYAKGGMSGRGDLTGASHRCQLDGCTGRRLSVRWPDGRHTFPCTQGMNVREDGEWEIG